MECEANKLIRKMINIGLRPKYRAFDYVFFILSLYDASAIIKMKREDIINQICEQFSITKSAAESSLCKFIESCTVTNQMLNEEMPYLDNMQTPCVREFFIVLSLLIDDEQ